MDIPLYLSGNFGELRSNHFHSGIDFKTQGVVGKAIKSVDEGYISRISVSPYGYGRAIYVDHPNGTTSVYAHLEYFSPKIEQAVIDSQYMKQSFAVNLFFAPEDFPLRRGEVFAYGGNTGSSGGPHLHFELRDTKTEIPFDPLPFFKERIKDTTRPDIRGIMIYPVDNSGLVNGSGKKRPFDLNANKTGIVQSVTAWGEIGIGIKAYDRMNEVSNIYGVNEIILKLDGDTVYHSVMNRFSFDDTRYLNSYIDWEDWIDNRSFYMKSFVEPGNFLGINQRTNSGIITIDEERAYHLEYILKDIYHNTANLKFSITGKQQAIPQRTMKEYFFWFNRDNDYADKGIELSIPRHNLYTNIDLDIDTVANYNKYSSLFKIGERIPLHSYCPLIIEISDDSFPDKSKYGLIHLYKGKTNWIGGEYINGKIKARIRELGHFAVTIDNISPVIAPISQTQWTKSKKISFKITDDLSGIASYKGTLDGEFVLFEFDAKRNLLFCNYDPKRMKAGKQLLELTVTDGAGNISHFESMIVF